MGSVRDFSFILWPDKKDRLWFIIKYTDDKEPSSGIIMDRVDVWREHVQKKLKNDMTPDEIVQEMRDEIWDDIETRFREACSENNDSIDEDSFQKAVESFFAVLSSIAAGCDVRIDNPYDEEE